MLQASLAVHPCAGWRHACAGAPVSTSAGSDTGTTVATWPPAAPRVQCDCAVRTGRIARDLAQPSATRWPYLGHASKAQGGPAQSKAQGRAEGGGWGGGLEGERWCPAGMLSNHAAISWAGGGWCAEAGSGRIGTPRGRACRGSAASRHPGTRQGPLP